MHPNYNTPKFVARFWAKVDKVSDPNGCWLWTGAISSSGYGSYGAPQGTVSTHRYAYALTYGPIDSKLLVCHRCDVKLCVNPSHLFLGTHADNALDYFDKGFIRISKPRKQNGEANSNSRLTHTQVLAIRALCDAGIQQKDVARQFGIDPSNVSNIVSRKTWKHI
jgi:hypothetical protein